jgi:hypothetical protein
MSVRMRALLLSLPLAFVGVFGAHAADCAVEAQTLVKDESQLPRLDVVSRADRPVLCITLETVMAFAARLKTHVAHCPSSNFVAAAGNWEKMRLD